MKRNFLGTGVLCFALLFPTIAAAKNLHLVDADRSTGFALYRSGAPTEEDVRKFCRLGIQEIYVLSGNAKDFEVLYHESCPTLEVVYDEKQSVGSPLTAKFLDEFDGRIAAAQKEGRKIAFRCNCGCHRTGRLAAYYNMKYRGFSIRDALDDMRQHGKFMWWYMRKLKPQVVALSDFINHEKCELTGHKARYCVVGGP